MKNQARVWMALMTGLLSLAACGGSETNLYAQLSDAEDDAVAVLCECFAATGANSEQECVSNFGGDTTPTEEACAASVYETFRAEALENTRCRVRVYDEAIDCLNDVAACDQPAVEACFDAAGAGIEACPSLPDTIEQAYDACFD
ncbi:MAG: hypothetical protein R3B40_05045 [Polyangiales bacterium]|nr:hypothetical protein [Sandaracinaceae bacterium]